jgi:Tfp pilus assembly protein PilX
VSRPRPDAGFSVVVVTTTIHVLLVLGLSLVAVVSENSGLSAHHVESNRAFYAAQAGVEYAIVKLSTTPSWGGLPAPGKACQTEYARQFPS